MTLGRASHKQKLYETRNKVTVHTVTVNAAIYVGTVNGHEISIFLSKRLRGNRSTIYMHYFQIFNKIFVQADKLMFFKKI